MNNQLIKALWTVKQQLLKFAEETEEIKTLIRESETQDEANLIFSYFLMNIIEWAKDQ